MNKIMITLEISHDIDVIALITAHLHDINSIHHSL